MFSHAWMIYGAVNGDSPFGGQFGGIFLNYKYTYPTALLLGINYSGKGRNVSAQDIHVRGAFRLCLLFHHKDGLPASALEKYATVKTHEAGLLLVD